MEEVYKVIEGYENYEVSNLGNLRNIKTKRVLKPGKDSSGYYMVILYTNSVGTTKRIHKLVANAYLDNPDDKKCVDHINNNRLENNLSNLRWATISENSFNQKIAKNNTSGSKGVSFHKIKNKWQAYIKLDGILIHLGYFENKEDAIQARITKANQIFGVYANACETI